MFDLSAGHLVGILISIASLGVFAVAWYLWGPH
jgi:hypothetical protein